MQIKKNKTKTKTQALNITIEQIVLVLYLKDIPHKCDRIQILLKCKQKISRINKILGHKIILDKFKKTEIIASIFSDQNFKRLDINYRKKEL